MHLPSLDYSKILPGLFAAIPSALLIVIAAIILNVMIGRGLTALVTRTSMAEKEMQPVRRAIKWLIAAGALVLVLGAFGMNIGGVWGILSTILAMIAVGFIAVWSVLSNTLCTLMIIFFRPFSIGDEIEFAGEPVKGRVADLNFLYTTLEVGDGSLLQIPNNLFFQKVVKRRPGAAAIAPEAHLRAKKPEPTPVGIPAAL